MKITPNMLFQNDTVNLFDFVISF